MDYNQTLNLPKTDFPMKANLPQREPEIQQSWEEHQIYHKIQEEGQESSGGPSLFFMTALLTPTAISISGRL